MLSRLPVVGYALRCAREDRPLELGLLILNFVLLASLVTLAFGYPGFITMVLAFTAAIAVIILIGTVE